MTVDTHTVPQGFHIPGWLVSAIRVLLVAGLPLVLVLINARLLMSNAYLRWEYNKPGFPDDPYGFTREDRLQYAPLALAYLFNNAGVEFLGDQTFPDGSPLYNDRELSHMHDVKVVTRGLVRFGMALVIVYAAGIVVLAVSPAAHADLYAALLAGSVLTVALLVTGLITVSLAFDWLFVQFHALFFEGASWIFPTSDTLIRLFPEPFWIDAFALIFGGALVEAVILAGAMWALIRRERRSHSAPAGQPA
jgi:integral membrane protein (TIGR01906 family)